MGGFIIWYHGEFFIFLFVSFVLCNFICFSCFLYSLFLLCWQNMRSIFIHGILCEYHYVIGSSLFNLNPINHKPNRQSNLFFSLGKKLKSEQTMVSTSDSIKITSLVCYKSDITQFFLLFLGIYIIQMPRNYCVGRGKFATLHALFGN